MRSVVIAALIAVLAAMAWWALRGTPSATAPHTKTAIAIIPFEGLSENADAYLRVALADELVTLLSRTPGLTVRPFAQSRQFDGSDPDRTARILHADLLLTGHYVARGDRLEIGLELANPHENTVVWRGNLEVPRNDSLSLNEALSTWVRMTLLPELGVAPEPGSPVPADARAYELYLRSLALTEDPASAEHQQAKRMLERSLALDPGYAPAWDAFARRLYLDSQTASTGGERAFRRAEAAQQRALDIDPDLIEAATGLTNMRTERGELRLALEAARAKVSELPRNALTHFSLSYVLRYMGRVDEALRECEVAYGLDPQIRLRSCALPYAMTGNYRRAHDFLDLDAGSDWVENKRAAVLVRQGREREALAIWRQLPREYSSVAFWIACLDGSAEETVSHLSALATENTRTAFDPEVKYWNAALQAWCGQHETALQLLETAVDQNYCSYPVIDSDPLWNSMREDREFRRIRDKAIDCHQRFLALE